MNQKTNCPYRTKLFEVPGEFFNTTVSCPTCNGKFNPMKELTKGFYESTKTPESQASFKAHMAEVKKNITHADFVAGVQNRTMGLKVPFVEPTQLLRGGRKTVFDILVLLYVVAPFILVPLWAYHEHNWWLLIGILIHASARAPQPSSCQATKLFRHGVASGILLEDFFLSHVFFFVRIMGIHVVSPGRGGSESVCDPIPDRKS
jgi:hypothetical protein